MRVGILALQHESNTFVTTPTTWQDFEQGALLRGAAIGREYGDSHHEIGGFFQGLTDAGIEAVPVFVAWALPGGPVESHTLDKLLDAMFVELKHAGPLDGLLVAPHGAGVATSRTDMDGYWLREVRSRVGPRTPMVGTLDLHANLSDAMVRATDALIGYRTNPHLDQRDRGVEAARLLARTLRGEVHPTQAAAYPPLAINIERQATDASPCRECFEALDDMLADHRVLSNSFLLGFPYADVREMGASALVVTDDDPLLAETLAHQFAEHLVQRRREFAGHLVETEAAVRRALDGPGPVCLLDMGDNVGGGAPGDGTVLLRSLCEHGMARAFVCLFDPQSVEQAAAAGSGARLEVQLGGKTDPRSGEPLHCWVRVRGLHSGEFSESRARHGGRTHYSMGPTAIVELEAGPTVMLTSRRVAPFSLEQLASCGIRPSDFQVIVAKGVHAPAAAYAPVCTELMRVNTPGVTMADITRFEYRNRRRPLFPFEAN